MSSHSVSYFDIEGYCVVPGPVPAASLDPDAGNVFPKFVNQLSDTAWELWYFDGGSDNGRTAFTLKEGGWRVQIFAQWPDGSMWNNELYFVESVVTTDGGGSNGRVHGFWSVRDNQSGVSFTVDPGLSAATLSFNIPQRVVGTVVLKTLDGNRQGFPSSEAAALLCPDMYYIRPISLAGAEAHLVFHSAGTDGAGESSREFTFVSGRGGMDRCWTSLSWPQLLSESYFQRAHVGPYNVQLMRILLPAASGRTPYVTARLWKHQELVCAAQQVIEAADLERLSSEGSLPAQDFITIAKVYENNEEGGGSGVTGAFRDKNVGYTIQFVGGEREGGGESTGVRPRWRFQVRHVRPWWNMPTSPPGPNATGNSAFLDVVTGGAQGEVWPSGTGDSGQLEL
ncbi:hypothetical protein C8A03DRAFT_36411 [Achaetomium macrosporum]|uniref:Diels-Alderase n=1 Tax=Achaetomium macrosporum TaxID=79813 RepID=A0AAN7C6L4_9PEZI|nr:hypothetical protein C8A03DRAFT_36411 [Achaetomium macrosporum]